jgi:hypothetical protein
VKLVISYQIKIGARIAQSEDLNDQCVILGEGRNFSVLQDVQTVSVPHPTSCPVKLFPRIVKNSWKCNSALPYVFMASCLTSVGSVGFPGPAKRIRSKITLTRSIL